MTTSTPQPDPTVPTVTQAVENQLYQNMEQTSSGGTEGGDGGLLAGGSQGVGASYLSFLPAYLQGTIGGNGANILQDASSGNDPVFNWLQQNGYIGNIVTDNSGQSTITPGSKAADLGPQGRGVGNQLVLAPDNPFGVNTIGAIDQKEMQTPQQAPQDYGYNSTYGAPTVSKNNLQSNQDFWSQYFVPGLEAAAGMAFGAVPGLADPAFAAGGFGEPGTMLSSIPGLGSSTDPTNGINTKALLAGAAGAAIGGGLNAVGAPSWTRQLINPALSMAQGGKPSLNPAQLALSLANAGSRYLE